MNAFQLISDLYRLLGEVDKQTLAIAERIAGSEELRDVIRALAVLSSDPSAPRPTTAPPKDRPSVPAVSPDASRPSLPEPTPAEELLSVVLAEARQDLTNRELITLLRRSAIDIPVGAKDGRARIIARASQRLSAMSDAKRAKALTKLRDALGVDQTTGWLHVVRNGEK